MRTRRTRMPIWMVEAKPAWGSSEIVLTHVVGDERKEVIIAISSPSDLNYLRERLDKLDAFWREELARQCPSNS